MTADNDNPDRSLGPRPVRALYGFLRPGSDELTFYEREMIERRREAVPLPKADDDA